MNRETTDKKIVYARNADMQGTFRKLTPIKYVTATRYLENTPEVQVCRRSVVNK